MKIKARLEPGKVAVVTGGSSGIGKAIACDLVKRGMHLWIVAQKEDLLGAARAEVEAHRKTQDQVIGVISADVSELDQVRMAVNQIYKASGPPDLLINAAGVAHPGYVQDLDIDIFKWMMATNYFGTVYMTKEVLPVMIKRSSGYILNISSGAGLISYFGYTAYAPSKFAVRGFSDALRQEMRLHGIGVSVLFPSDTDTPQLEYENKYKPAETKALSGTGGMMTAEAVSNLTLKAIENGKYFIIAGTELNLFHKLNGVSADLINFIIDRIISGVDQKKKTKSKEV